MVDVVKILFANPTKPDINITNNENKGALHYVNQIKDNATKDKLLSLLNSKTSSPKVIIF